MQVPAAFPGAKLGQTGAQSPSHWPNIEAGKDNREEGMRRFQPAGRWQAGPEPMHRRRRLLSALTLREPVSSASSCFRRAVLYALPWGQPSCGRCVSLSCVPACLQSWWCLPRVTSFAAISSGFPAKRVSVTSMLTGIFAGEKTWQRSHLAGSRPATYSRLEQRIHSRRCDAENSEKLESYLPCLCREPESYPRQRMHRFVLNRSASSVP